MEITTLITIGIGIVVTIIGYFSRTTIENSKKDIEKVAEDLKNLEIDMLKYLREIESKVNDNTTQIKLVEQNHNSLKESFTQSFKDVMSALSDLKADIKADIKELTRDVAKKRDKE